MAVALEAVWLRVKNVCKQNGLLIMSVLAVVIGCLLGFFLRTRRLSEQEVKYFQFPGELLMRMLKMLILPLVVSSLMSGLAALDAKCSSRLGLITVSYYLWTTFVAVVVGIFMVSIIHPGGAAQKEDSEDSAKPIMSSADALLDLIRNMFPANLVQATFQQYRTSSEYTLQTEATPEPGTPRPLIYGIRDDNGSDVRNFSLDLTPPPNVLVRTKEGTSDGMNVLGIVIFSATMGIMLGRMGPNGSALVNFCQSLNEAVLKIVAIVIWYFPFGIVFLVAGKILEMSDPSAMGKKLGFYAVTVVFGLVLHGLFILPAMYFFITKKSPIVYIRGILQALLIALATSSSASWRTTTSTGASSASCCPWAPPSTWTGPRSTRPWPPSSSRRSTTTSWTSDRSSPSGRWDPTEPFNLTSCNRNSYFLLLPSPPLSLPVSLHRASSLVPWFPTSFFCISTPTLPASSMATSCFLTCCALFPVSCFVTSYFPYPPFLPQVDCILTPSFLISGFLPASPLTSYFLIPCILFPAFLYLYRQSH
ncbi:solute carrier family 1 member 7b isoform X9 [Phycodurus eques]|uniref:solute carrier family 1 member 7b isoform X9 n=1 Tax=Phycodurus eques TaxID=693459 RepID=UPI002ACDDE32|nr:solute carrier family 1 member 7b isoform X9 [Phycodurus eques]